MTGIIFQYYCWCDVITARSFVGVGTTGWAVLMVHSRAFTLPVIAEEHYAPYVMMPYMDMINHHYRYQVLLLIPMKAIMDWVSSLSEY